MAETPRTITVQITPSVRTYLRPMLEQRLRWLDGEGVGSISDLEQQAQVAKQTARAAAEALGLAQIERAKCVEGLAALGKREEDL